MTSLAGPASTTYPPSMKSTRSATCRANSISCVTTTMVIPASARLRMTWRTSPTVSGSSAEVGSSKSMTSGSMLRALAIATRCCWPPDRDEGLASIFSDSPTFARFASATVFASALERPRTLVWAMVRFSRTVRWPKRLKDWNTMPMRVRAASMSRSRSIMSIPSTTIEPPVGVSSVLMQRSIVDLPDPEGPMTQTTSPLSTSRLMSVRT